jgi:hypothetical protein
VNKRQIVFLGLKGVNLALATVMSFALIWILIRKLPLASYSTFVLIVAMGSYVMATDLGFSSVVYHRVRKAFLGEDPASEKSLVFTASGLYFGVVAIAEVLMILWMHGGGVGGDLVGAFAIYFLALALSLPWGLMRAIAGALDLYLHYEAIEAARRTVLTGLLFAMAMGMSLKVYALIALALWPMAYALLLPSVFRLMGGGERGWRHLWRPRAAIAENGRMLGAASLFSLMEFGIYNFPYVALPLIFGRGPALVAFDVFFKVTRFGAQSYLVPNESLLPMNTRAIHERDGRKLLRNVAAALAISAVACAIGAGAVLLFGETLFRLLLKNAGLVPPTLRWCMAVILVAMMFQAASGTLLLNSGKMGVLSRVSLGMAVSMSLMTAAVVTLHLPFLVFMQSYVAVFSIGATVYFTLLVRSVRRLLGPHRQW